MEFWKILIILEEFKKPSGKFFRVLAKNQLRFENFEKILKCLYKNLNRNLIFYAFSLPSSWTFVILYTSGTYQNFWGCFGGSSAGLGVIFEFWRVVVGCCINPCRLLFFSLLAWSEKSSKTYIEISDKIKSRLTRHLPTYQSLPETLWTYTRLKMYSISLDIFVHM